LLHTGHSVLPLDARTLVVPLEVFFNGRISGELPMGTDENGC